MQHSMDISTPFCNKNPVKESPGSKYAKNLSYFRSTLIRHNEYQPICKGCEISLVQVPGGGVGSKQDGYRTGLGKNLCNHKTDTLREH